LGGNPLADVKAVVTRQIFKGGEQVKETMLLLSTLSIFDLRRSERRQGKTSSTAKLNFAEIESR
jgi:hypothetical protein